MQQQDRTVTAVRQLLEKGEGCFFDELDDLMVRNDGVLRALKEKGFTEDEIFWRADFLTDCFF